MKYCIIEWTVCQNPSLVMIGEDEAQDIAVFDTREEAELFVIGNCLHNYKIVEY